MGNIIYEQFFDEYGIAAPKDTGYYSPEEFGRRLLRESQIKTESTQITYAYNTPSCGPQSDRAH